MIDTELAIILNEYLYKRKIINFDLYNDALKKLGVDCSVMLAILCAKREKLVDNFNDFFTFTINYHISAIVFSHSTKLVFCFLSIPIGSTTNAYFTIWNVLFMSFIIS